VQAISEEMFHIYAIQSVEQGIELLTGVPAGEPINPAPNTVFAHVEATLARFHETLLPRRNPS
jgi:hypothetical protein